MLFVQEIIPDAKTLQGMSASVIVDVENLKPLINKSIGSICINFSSLSHLSATDQFHWSFIVSCCHQVQLDNIPLHELSSYSFILEKFSKVFQAYCKDRVVILDEIPEDIACISNSNVKEYFKWVKKLQNIFRHWHEKFMKQEYNYDDILTYASSQPTLKSLAKCFSSNEFIFDPEQIEGFKKQYSKIYGEICLILVRSYTNIPG